MAIAFRAESHVVGTGTSPTGTEPAGTVQGDVLIAFFATAAAGDTPGIPAGWTSLHAGLTATLAREYVLCYIVRGASAPALTFTTTGSVYRELHILSYSGVDTTNPIDDYAVTVSTSGNDPDAPLVSATSTSDMAVAIGINSFGSSTGGYGAPSGYTINSNNTAGYNTVIASKVLSASGNEDPAAFTNSGATADIWAATVLLNPSGSSGNTATPLLKSEYVTDLGMSVSPNTLSVTVNATSELLVVVGISGDSSATISTPTGGTGVTWTLQNSDTTASYCGVYIWTATNISPQTFTLSVAGSTTGSWGFGYMKFAGATAGNSTKGQNASGTPSVSLSTSQANSAILAVIGDWSAVNGSSRAWLTNAGTLSEQEYLFLTGNYTSYMGLHKNAGAIGSYTVGLSTPSAQKYNMIALEIKGIAAAPVPIAWITA